MKKNCIFPRLLIITYFITGCCKGNADPCQKLRQSVGWGREDDTGTTGHQKRRQARSKETPGGEGWQRHDVKYRSMSRRHVGCDRFQIKNCFFLFRSRKFLCRCLKLNLVWTNFEFSVGKSGIDTVLIMESWYRYLNLYHC